MDLKRLETFRVVARSGSLRQAAMQIGLTLPAVSIQIRKLEEDLGVALFTRLPNRLVLTDRGRIFLDELGDVFNALERATSAVADARDDYSGSLSLALGTDVAPFFARRVADFIDRYPDMKISVYSRPSFGALSMVVEGEADMAIGYHPQVPRGFDNISIFQTALTLICPEDQPLPEPLTLASIAERRIITQQKSAGIRRILDATLGDPDPRRIIEVATCHAAHRFVKLGLGVALVHNCCAELNAMPGVKIVDATRFFGTADVSLVTRPEKRLKPGTNAFIQTLTGALCGARRSARERKSCERRDRSRQRHVSCPHRACRCGAALVDCRWRRADVAGRSRELDADVAAAVPSRRMDAEWRSARWRTDLSARACTGLHRALPFVCESRSTDRAEFVAQDDASTRALYPFAFELRVDLQAFARCDGCRDLRDEHGVRDDALCLPACTPVSSGRNWQARSGSTMSSAQTCQSSPVPVCFPMQRVQFR